MVELGYNYFQFIFLNNEEKARVLQKRSWFFDNQMVVVQPWKQDLKRGDPSFNQTPMQAQIGGPPNHWSSKEVGQKLGKLFPSCLNVVLPASGRKDGRVLKLLVKIALD